MQHKMQFEFSGYTLKKNQNTSFLLTSYLGTQGGLALHTAFYTQGFQSPLNHLHRTTSQLNKW